MMIIIFWEMIIIKGYEIGETSSMHGITKIYTKFWPEILKERDFWEDFYIDKWTILN
jgi:hypothetical protein